MTDFSEIKATFAEDITVGAICYESLEDFEKGNTRTVVSINTRFITPNTYYDLTFDDGKTSTHRQDRKIVTKL